MYKVESLRINYQIVSNECDSLSNLNYILIREADLDSMELIVVDSLYHNEKYLRLQCDTVALIQNNAITGLKKELKSAKFWKKALGWTAGIETAILILIIALR